MANDNNTDEQEREWEELYARLEQVLGKFGTSDYMGRADYWVVDDNWGCCQHKVYVNSLNLLAPHIVKLLQGILKGFPDWEVIVAVSPEDAGLSWPKMGLIIRPHEIIDGLQRQFFPKAFQRIVYEESKRGIVFNEE